MANSLWVVPLYPLTESFTRTAMDDYGAASRSLEREPQESAKAINDWISEVTKGEITAPVSPEALGPLTRAVLVNAVYFHGRWVFAFSKELTRPAPFRGRGGGALPADFMHGEAKVRLRGAGRLAVIPYMGGWQMEVELPAKATAAGLEAAMADLHRDDKGTVCEDTPIALPKWKTTSQLELIDTMKRLGVRDVFDSARSDLTGISPRAAADRLFVSSAVRDAVIEVDEEGTKAAASTVIVEQTVSAPSRAPECPALLSFDRPFAYVIRHSQTGEILFSGTVLNPSPPARLP